MKFLLIFIQILLFYKIGTAQQVSRFEFFVGYGFYEGFCVGSQYNFISNRQSMGFSAGFVNHFQKYHETYTFSLNYNVAIFTNLKNESNEFKWQLSNRAIFWQSEDDFYVWRVVSLIPSAGRNFRINRILKISVDVGPAFNIVLYNKRKTYTEVGWPYHVMPNFRMIFIF